MGIRSAALALVLAACSPQAAPGPAPVVLGARSQRDHTAVPAYLCNAQGDASDGWLVDVVGDRFAAVPEVNLSGPESYTVPAAYVRFRDRTTVTLAMRTSDTARDPHALAAGDYTVTVRNPDGGAATSPLGAVRVLGPPRVSAVSLSPGGARICADADQVLTVSGAGFRGDLPLAVSIGSHTFTATASDAATITVAIAAGTFGSAETSAAGTPYVVTVTNPEGCQGPSGADPRAPATVSAFPTCTPAAR